MKIFSLDSLAALASEDKEVKDNTDETPIVQTVEPIPTYTSYDELDLDKLIPFENQPFKPYVGDKFTALCESISNNGILTPLTVRPYNMGYQILSGHNRARAAKECGLITAPAVIKNLDDDEAWIELIETNLNQREKLLPSEKAFAYKIKMQKIKHQGKSDTSRHAVGKLESADVIGRETEESGRQIQRYIRLTHLTPSLLDLVDEGEFSFVAAVEISYLSPSEQIATQEYFFSQNSERKLDLNTAKILRELADKQEITLDLLRSTLQEKKKTVRKDVTIKFRELKKVIPSTYDRQNLEQLIIELLKEHFKEN